MRRRRPIPRAAAIVASPPATTKDGPRDATAVDRAIDELAEAINRVVDPGQGFVEVDLIVGTNRINHGLGRIPLGVDVVPKDAASAFAWGYDWTQPDNPVPDRQIWLDVVGAPVTARVFMW